MAGESKHVTVAVGGHWLLGSLPLAGNRIQEALNDARTDFVKLSDVEVHPLAKCECLTTLPEVIIPKGKIEFVAVPASPHEAPEKRRNNRVAKEVYSAFAIVGDYSISGELHLPTKPADSVFVLTHQLSKFFALTGVTLSASRQGAKQLAVPLVFVNRDFVSCFQIGQPARGETADVGLLSLFLRDESLSGEPACVTR
jgi:hypothetical protein